MRRPPFDASKLRPCDPCSPGCLHHVSHPCENCGRIAGRTVESLFDAEARAERAEKALEEAYRAGLAAAEHSFTEYATFSDAPMSLCRLPQREGEEMNEERLKELEVLCEKATKGPWLSERFPMRPPLLIASGNAVICQFNHTRTMQLPTDVQEVNCALITESRTAMPDLINRVRELERALEQAVKLGDIHKPYSDSKRLYSPSRNELLADVPDLHKWLEEKGK